MVQFSGKVGTVILSAAGPYCFELNERLQKCYTHSYPLKRVCEKIEGEWLRVNNSYAVERQNIKGYFIGPTGRTWIVTQNGIGIRISRRKIKNVLKQLEEWKLLNCLKP